MKSCFKGIALAICMCLIGFTLVGCGGSSGSGSLSIPTITVSVAKPPTSAVVAASRMAVTSTVNVQIIDKDGNVVATAEASLTDDGKTYIVNVPIAPNSDMKILAYEGDDPSKAFYKALLPLSKINEGSKIEVNDESSVRANAYDAWKKKGSAGANTSMDKFEENLEKAIMAKGAKNAKELFGIKDTDNPNDENIIKDIENLIDLPKVEDGKLRAELVKDFSGGLWDSYGFLKRDSSNILITFDEELEWNFDEYIAYNGKAPFEITVDGKKENDVVYRYAHIVSEKDGKSAVRISPFDTEEKNPEGKTELKWWKPEAKYTVKIPANTLKGKKSGRYVEATVFEFSTTYGPCDPEQLDVREFEITCDPGLGAPLQQSSQIVINFEKPVKWNDAFLRVLSEDENKTEDSITELKPGEDFNLQVKDDNKVIEINPIEGKAWSPDHLVKVIIEDGLIVDYEGEKKTVNGKVFHWKVESKE